MTTQNQTSKEIQINWIVNKLENGEQRERFLEEFTRIYKLSIATFDNRLKEARKRYNLILEENKKENDRKLRNNPNFEEMTTKLLETKKTIYDSITYIILNKRKKVLINGVEKIVLDIPLREANYLKTLWEMTLTGLGEPTTISKNENNNNNLNTEYKVETNLNLNAKK
jgi:exonuclease VII small subunit